LGAAVYQRPSAPNQYTAPVSKDLQHCRDRAEEHRTFAERTSDPRVKALLLELADGYEEIANRE
jgi:hypothetical protein